MGTKQGRYYQRSSTSNLSCRDPTRNRACYAVSLLGFGNEAASRREVESKGVIEGKRNLVLHRCAGAHRHAPDDPTHGVDFLTGAQFEGQA